MNREDWRGKAKPPPDRTPPSGELVFEIDIDDDAPPTLRYAGLPPEEPGIRDGSDGGRTQDTGR